MTEELLQNALMNMAESYGGRNKQLEMDLALARAQVMTLQAELTKVKGETTNEENSDG